MKEATGWGPTKALGFKKARGQVREWRGTNKLLWDFKKRNLWVSKKQGDKWKNGGDKQVTLWDFKKRNLGHQIGKGDALNRSPKISTLVSPNGMAHRRKSVKR